MGAGSPDGMCAEAMHGFSAAAGPMPSAVRSRIARSCLDPLHGALSLPFTSPAYRALQTRVAALLRTLLAVPEDIDILFMAGGASAQFALVPLNLLRAQDYALYLYSGHWSRRTITEAGRYGRIIEVAASAVCRTEAADAAYCHYTSNETADGLQFHAPPDTVAPLVADMTSDLLSAPVDWPRYALVYAGTQKTLGVPGMCVVFVRRTLLGRAHPATPRVMDYGALSVADSRLSTPPVFAMHAALCMLEWLAGEGGVATMQTRQQLRAQRVYAEIDRAASPYRCLQPVAWRSHVNPCFMLPNATMLSDFLDASRTAGLDGLEGHSDVGGVRVSLYNGLDDLAVDALIRFMRDWAHARTSPST